MLLYKGKIGEHIVYLQKPHTFMNLSGEALSLAVQYFKIPIQNIMVIYDDIDIPFGTLRFRKNGGPGTQNGMRSIVNHLKSRDFPRLRVGVGPIPPRWNITDYVLSNFLEEEESQLPDLSNRISDCLPIYLDEGIQKTMLYLNSDLKEKEESTEKP